MKEQREYFRIKDHAWVDHRQLEGSGRGSNAEDYFNSASEFSLTAELQTVETEASSLLHAVAERDVELANYLRTVNRKIDILSRAIISAVHGEQQQAQEIDLSEASIRFCSNERTEPGQLLALRIMLESEALLLHCFAKVKNCSLVQVPDSYQISAELDWRTEGQQDLLARHILRQQARERREQRQGA